MLVNPLQARPEGVIGLLIMTLSILAFHATCNTFTSQSSPSHTAFSTSNKIPINDLNLGSIQSSISDISSSLSKINASLASLHAKINSQPQHLSNDQDEEQCLLKCHEPSASQAPVNEAFFFIISYFLLFSVGAGMAVFLNDASNVSGIFIAQHFGVYGVFKKILGWDVV